MGSLCRRGAIGDLDSQRLRRIIVHQPRPWILGHVVFPNAGSALGHEVEDAVEAPELEGSEERPVASRVLRSDVDEDKAGRVVARQGVELGAGGVGHGARVVVGDHHPAGHAPAELVEVGARHLSPAVVLLHRGPDLLRRRRATQAGPYGLRERQPADEELAVGIQPGEVQRDPAELLVLFGAAGPVQDESLEPTLRRLRLDSVRQQAHDHVDGRALEDEELEDALGDGREHALRELPSLDRHDAQCGILGRCRQDAEARREEPGRGVVDPGDAEARPIVEGRGDARRHREVQRKPVAQTRDIEQEHLLLDLGHRPIVSEDGVVQGDRAEATGQQHEEAGQDGDPHQGPQGLSAHPRPVGALRRCCSGDPFGG
jgi:hypothetical protein